MQGTVDIEGNENNGFYTTRLEKFLDYKKFSEKWKNKKAMYHIC